MGEYESKHRSSNRAAWWFVIGLAFFVVAWIMTIVVAVRNGDEWLGWAVLVQMAGLVIMAIALNRAGTAR